MIENERQHAAVSAFLEAARTGDRAAYVASLQALDWPTAWIEVFGALVRIGNVHPFTKSIFAEQWQGSIESSKAHLLSGHSIRGVFKDNISLLVDGLRILTNPVANPWPAYIYRGQSIAEFESGHVGLSWTSRPLLAEMYARHTVMNEAPCVVLSHQCVGSEFVGIITDNEMLVDPRLIKAPTIIYRPENKFSAFNTAEELLAQCELGNLDRIALDAIAAGDEVTRLRQAQHLHPRSSA